MSPFLVFFLGIAGALLIVALIAVLHNLFIVTHLRNNNPDEDRHDLTRVLCMGISGIQCTLLAGVLIYLAT